MEKAGIMERAISPNCNPLRIVIKENKSVQPCLDARQLNKILEDDLESPPLIGELLQKYHVAKLFQN